MKKPGHQWETAEHRAVRVERAPGPAWREDTRAECFELVFRDGTREAATVGLARQELGSRALRDPDALHAVRCWLAARGQRTTNLVTNSGQVVDRGAFDLASLGTAPGGQGAPPRRVVTIAPSNLEMVEALGCIDRVVACEDSSDWPADRGPVERLGPDLGPDLDRIAELKPDLVVSSLSVPGMERNVSGLRARGIPQVVLAPGSLADVMVDAQRVAACLGVQSAGLVARLQTERDALRGDQSGADPVRVYLEWWPRPMFTPGRDCYSNELIELAGGVNVFRDRAGSSVEIQVADLVEADPEVCFVSWCGVDEAKLDPGRLRGRAELADVSAIRGGQVHALDERYAGRPGPNMLEAARRMADAIRGVGCESGSAPPMRQ